MQLGEITCSDKNVRDDSKVTLSKKGKELSKTPWISERKWCKQYNIPRRTYRSWLAVHTDPKKAMRYGPGNAPKLDDAAKAVVRQELRDLQIATLERGPQPAKTKKVAQIIVQQAKKTLERAGQKNFSGGKKVTVATSTIAFYRDEIGGKKRKAKDISTARWKALTQTQHMFQSAVGLTVTLGNLDAVKKYNFDCTTVTIEPEGSGKVRCGLLF